MTTKKLIGKPFESRGRCHSTLILPEASRSLIPRTVNIRSSTRSGGQPPPNSIRSIRPEEREFEASTENARKIELDSSNEVGELEK